MRIYITAKKEKTIKWNNNPLKANYNSKRKWFINFDENGYVVQEEFEDDCELIKRLQEKPLYKQEMLPQCIDILEWIDKGFNIYM